uniref:Putative LOV domain-containing protein n=1 Tax=Argyrochosma nivea TaxID=414592 RepID=A0A126X3J1_9MONI|nr:putative LOV domain-containing protein [Argyrochosma nivea]
MGRPIPAPSSTRISAPSQSQVPTCTQVSITKCVEESLSRSYGESMKEPLQRLRHHSFLVTDPHLPGHPIVYVSEGFLHMTGYLAEEVMGRNPRFLQGPDTDRRSVLQIRDAICEEKPCHVILLNYTKQGWPFRIVFHMAPVFSQANGQLLHFVGAQKPLADCFSKQVWHCEASLLGLHKGPSAFLGPKICMDSINPRLKSHQPSDSCLNYQCSGQRKKKMKTASTILQLVVHELVTSNKLMSDKTVCGGCSSEEADTALCSSLTLALTRIQQSFVISDAKLPGMPVAYASDMFLRLTGYQRHEVIGRSCKFMQGQGTDTCAVEQIRDAIREDRTCTVRILNYRKNGSPFWNLLHVAPVRDHTAKVVYYVGVQWHLGFPLAEGSFASKDVTPAMLQLGAVGAVKVAVRSLQGHGLRRSSS